MKILLSLVFALYIANMGSIFSISVIEINGYIPISTSNKTELYMN
jgi:hypothetical protein